MAREVNHPPRTLLGGDAFVVQDVGLETAPLLNDRRTATRERIQRESRASPRPAVVVRDRLAAITANATTGTSLIEIAIAAHAPAQNGRSLTTRYASRRMNITNTGSVLPWKPEMTIKTGLTATITPAAVASFRLRRTPGGARTRAARSRASATLAGTRIGCSAPTARCDEYGVDGDQERTDQRRMVVRNLEMGGVDAEDRTQAVNASLQTPANGRCSFVPACRPRTEALRSS